VNGDSIYNGALDDGSGTSTLLVLARHFARNPEPRSIVILFTTAEEWGLLGARAFVLSDLIPRAQLVANLNMDDGIELWGRKRDVATLGVEHSTLGETVAQVARRKGLRMTPDPYPEEGFFLRSDQFPFAEAGIPSLYMALGTDAVGRPKGWVDEKVKDYLANHYHRPSDEYANVVVDLDGVVQLAEFVRDVTSIVARARTRPAWLRHSEFASE
jgi:Zn-dependent M28 family amino/carboxypeptidase